MAVLISSEVGWIISHESYIKKIYEKTNHPNGWKSYCLNSGLFDIEFPYNKKKNCEEFYSIKTLAGDVEFVKTAHDKLYDLYKSLNDNFSDSRRENNISAKSLADNFYIELTRHPSVKFLGGNNSSTPLVSQIGNDFYLIPEKCFFYCYDVRDISLRLKEKVFDFILMDPPWWNKYIRRKRKKNYKLGYDMVYDKDLSSIPIDSLLHKDGIIGVWCTSAPSHINAIRMELFPAWNVEYSTQWFWLKVTKHGKPVCNFSQPLRKQPFERIIFGYRKNSGRKLPEKEKVIMSIPSAIHSHKPPLCELMKPYLPQEPKCLELFARYLLPSWTSYGNEVLKLQHMSLYQEECLLEKS